MCALPTIQPVFRKITGIVELVLGFILVVLIFVGTGTYWKYLPTYEETLCKSLILRDPRGYRSDIYPENPKICLWASSKYAGEEDKCKYFLSRELDPPVSPAMQSTVGLGIILLVLTFAFRVLVHLYYLYKQKITDIEKLAIVDFWSINWMINGVCCSLIGIFPIIQFKYTHLCVQDNGPQYNDDYSYPHSVLYFYIISPVLAINNLIWFSILIHHGCPKICPAPHLFYIIINILIWFTMTIIIFVASKGRGIGMGMGIMFLIWGFGYWIYIGLFIKDYPKNSVATVTDVIVASDLPSYPGAYPTDRISNRPCNYFNGDNSVEHPFSIR